MPCFEKIKRSVDRPAPSVAKLKSWAKDEYATSKEYMKAGYPKQAADELRHARHFGAEISRHKKHGKKHKKGWKETNAINDAWDEAREKY